MWKKATSTTCHHSRLQMDSSDLDPIFIPHDSAYQTASRSVSPLLQSSPVCQTHTHRPCYVRRPPQEAASMLCKRCGLKSRLQIKYLTKLTLAVAVADLVALMEVTPVRLAVSCTDIRQNNHDDKKIEKQISKTHSVHFWTEWVLGWVSTNNGDGWSKLTPKLIQSKSGLSEFWKFALQLLIINLPNILRKVTRYIHFSHLPYELMGPTDESTGHFSVKSGRVMTLQSGDNTEAGFLFQRLDFYSAA